MTWSKIGGDDRPTSPGPAYHTVDRSGPTGPRHRELLASLEHGERGGDGAEDPEGADQIFERVLEDDIVYGEDEDGQRAGEGKGPGGPHRDEAQATQHEANEHSA